MKSKSILSTLILFLSLCISTQAFALKNCKKGQPCGNACISKDDVCHMTESGSAHTATQAEEPKVKESAKAEKAEAKEAKATNAPAATETAAPKAKVCKKGKACGNACIPAKAVCHAK